MADITNQYYNSYDKIYNTIDTKALGINNEIFKEIYNIINIPNLKLTNKIIKLVEEFIVKTTYIYATLISPDGIKKSPSILEIFHDIREKLNNSDKFIFYDTGREAFSLINNQTYKIFNNKTYGDVLFIDKKIKTQDKIYKDILKFIELELKMILNPSLRKNYDRITKINNILKK